MCIIAIAHKASSRYPLILCANRDEHHTRATTGAHWWPESHSILAGKDLQAGGTWLAVDRSGRFGAVTNLEIAGGTAGSGARSRGHLITNFLADTGAVSNTTEEIAAHGKDYGPFNLLLFDGKALHYLSNFVPSRTLEPAIHVLSNAAPGVEWPKITEVKRGLEALLEDPSPTRALFRLLHETRPAANGWTARQTSVFQRNPIWGTRCSTVVLVDRNARLYFTERRFDADGNGCGEDSYEFQLER